MKTSDYEGIMICGLDGKELVEMISMVYRKLQGGITDVKDVTLSFEDMVQEGLCRIIECNPKNVGHARNIVRNWFIDKIRYSYRRSGRLPDSYSCINDAGNVLDEQDVVEEVALHPTLGSGFGDSIAIQDMLSQIKNPKERRFAVAKGYLAEGIEELADEFYQMLGELDEASLDLYMSTPKCTDDMIYKVFCGIKSGVNAGSSRVIRGGLKAALLGAEV